MGIFIEIINAATSVNLVLERHLPYPWGLVSRWNELEPSTLHVAVPLPIILAMITVFLCHGMPADAFLIWAGMRRCLRPVETY